MSSGPSARKLKARCWSASWYELRPRSKSDAVGRDEARVAGDVGCSCSKFAWRSVTRLAEVGQPLTRPGDGRLIGVDPEQAAIR